MILQTVTTFSLILMTLNVILLFCRNQKLQKDIARLTIIDVGPYTVQHCNSKTDYEMIVHVFNPDGCKHCDELRNLVSEINGDAHERTVPPSA